MTWNANILTTPVGGGLSKLSFGAKPWRSVSSWRKAESCEQLNSKRSDGQPLFANACSEDRFLVSALGLGGQQGRFSVSRGATGSGPCVHAKPMRATGSRPRGPLSFSSTKNTRSAVQSGTVPGCHTSAAKDIKVEKKQARSKLSEQIRAKGNSRWALARGVFLQREDAASACFAAYTMPLFVRKAEWRGAL